MLPQLEATFETIGRVAREAFGDDLPALVCEPGRALCGDAFTLAARVKAVRDDLHVFLNDGIYGSLFELGQIGIIDRIEVLDPQGQRRNGSVHGRICFGPTCESVLTGCQATCPSRRYCRGGLCGGAWHGRLFDGDQQPLQRFRRTATGNGAVAQAVNDGN